MIGGLITRFIIPEIRLLDYNYVENAIVFLSRAHAQGIVFSLQNATHPLTTENTLPKFCPIRAQMQDDHIDPRELLGPCQYHSAKTIGSC